VVVLVGDFGTVGTAGLEAMIEAQGLGLTTRTLPVQEIASGVSEGGTRVVVLDGGMPDARETALRIGVEHADIRVIVCSLDDTTMLVFPGRGEAPYEAPLDPPRLAAAIGERR